MKFAKWINPKNGATRIYVNGATSQGKVFVQDGAVSKNFPAGYPEIIVVADGYISQADKDAIIDRVADAAGASTFAEYLALTV